MLTNKKRRKRKEKARKEIETETEEERKSEEEKRRMKMKTKLVHPAVSPALDPSTLLHECRLVISLIIPFGVYRTAQHMPSLNLSEVEGRRDIFGTIPRRSCHCLGLSGVEKL